MIGKTISNYKILDIIGSGGMGVVYKAEDTNLKRNVALKFLPPELTRDKETEERFIREAQSASSLQHNNICTIHEINKTDDGRFFICMDYYEGETLKEKISRRTLNFDETVDISIQISEGLEKAHKKGIIHRDIKPANIFITTEGVVKILDFGLAKLSGRTKLTKTQSTLGTVAYMSPEQASGDEVDYKTDIWSFGVILYEMIAEQLPFKGEYEQAVVYSIMNEDPKHPREFQNNLPEDFERIILRSLEKDPKSRYSTITELLKDLMNFQPTSKTPPIRFKKIKNILKLFKKPKLAIPFTLIILAISFLLIRFTHRLTEIREAKNEVIPEIERLAEEGHYSTAFKLATKAKQHIPDDPMLVKLWPRFSRYLTIRSEPNNANIFWKEYNAKDGEDWQYAGVTPLDNIRFPIGFSRIKIEKKGFRTIYDATSSDQLNQRRYLLDENGNIPESMVRIPSVRIQVTLQNREDIHEVQIKDYLIDKYEVTNSEYKRFVDSGGYRNKQYWKQSFMKDEQTLSWNEAVALFIDQTGRPGPATWQAGDYPEGEGDYPVTGVCWYEAEAYADFMGKSLPTYYHWRRAAGLDTRQRLPKMLGEFDMSHGNSFVILASNFNNSGSLPKGTNHAMSSFGTHDMAGNAREWCWNKSSLSGQRLTLGGGWSDPPYMFTDKHYSQPSFDRSPMNGFRCVTYHETDENLTILKSPIKSKVPRDFMSEQPVSDQEFEIFKRMYAYDKTDLNAVIESEDHSKEIWIKQKISFDAAYGNERVIAYLFLPNNIKPPYQVVVYFPGASALRMLSSTSLLTLNNIDFIVRDGRAVIYPVFKGTYERRYKERSTSQSEIAYKEHVIQWYKDLARSIDYLETRIDIDTAKLAYYGFSWGGRLGPLMVAIEKRIKVCVLYVAGLSSKKHLPEVDPFTFLPRMKIPVLMLNGKYDASFIYKTSQRPMFELLGTSQKLKRKITYDSGHFVPRNQLIKEVLNWLDQHLEPVQR